MNALPRIKARALFFDIDDTFTSHGKITAEAFTALWRAHDAGLPCVAVTGRPAGWCDHIARLWPVSGVVGENGACAFWFDKKLRRLDTLTPQARAKNRLRLARLGARILEQVAGSALASDQPYREYDLAIDFCEDVKPLSKAKVQKIVALFEAAGATAKISSIHVNGWFGNYGKKEMALRFAKTVLGLKDFSDCVYVGDSPNDQPMWEAFDLSVGVANVRNFWNELTTRPRFVMKGESGSGFAELVNQLIR